MKLERSDRGPLIAFILPALVMMVVFFVIPVIYVVVISLFKWIEVFNYMIPPVNDLVRIILIVLLSLTFDIGIGCMLSKISFIRKAFGAK